MCVRLEPRRWTRGLRACYRHRFFSAVLHRPSTSVVPASGLAMSDAYNNTLVLTPCALFLYLLVISLCRTTALPKTFSFFSLTRARQEHRQLVQPTVDHSRDDPVAVQDKQQCEYCRSFFLKVDIDPPFQQRTGRQNHGVPVLGSSDKKLSLHSSHDDDRSLVPC